MSSTIIFYFIIFPFISMASGKAVDITDVRYWSYKDYTRVVITLSDKADFKKNRISNPDRLFFDIKNSRIKKELQTNQQVRNGMLKSVRTAQFNEDTVRVVLDLEKVSDYKIVNLEDPVRIIIDIFGHSTVSTKKRIVLDPGHGGHDPGAIGPNNVYEKDVVLDVALKLRKILTEDGKYDVFLTREKDVFIPLEERTAIANSKNADLFLSIHANASPNRKARGIETYLLNWTNDEEAIRVAARENAISLKKMRQMHKEMDIVELIKNDLMRENKRDESIKLANFIQHSMIGNLNRQYPNVINLGVKQALFYVLFGARMPSVLVEISFISNPLEEKLLSNEQYREELAKSIASGVARYMASVKEIPAVASIGKTVVP